MATSFRGALTKTSGDLFVALYTYTLDCIEQCIDLVWDQSIFWHILQLCYPCFLPRLLGRICLLLWATVGLCA